MATNDYSNITGFVLREFKYKETSKIIEVFTEEIGRISIMARGVLRPKNTNLSSCQRFVKANYNLAGPRGEFYYLKDGSLIKSYSKSNKKFDIIVYKSAICDLLLRTMDQIQNDLVYNLLDASFLAFEEAEKNWIDIFFAFLLKYISFSGYKPNFKTCGNCGREIIYDDLFFSKELSSLICPSCKDKIYKKTYLTGAELLYLNKLLYTKSTEIDKIERNVDLKKIGELIMDYCLEKLELKRFNSIDWVYKSIGD